MTRKRYRHDITSVFAIKDLFSHFRKIPFSGFSPECPSFFSPEKENTPRGLQTKSQKCPPAESGNGMDLAKFFEIKERTFPGSVRSGALQQGIRKKSRGFLFESTTGKTQFSVYHMCGTLRNNLFLTKHLREMPGIFASRRASQCQKDSLPAKFLKCYDVLGDGFSKTPHRWQKYQGGSRK